MATYVISDIHGQYDMFVDLLEKIKLKDMTFGIFFTKNPLRCSTAM